MAAGHASNFWNSININTSSRTNNIQASEFQFYASHGCSFYLALTHTFVSLSLFFCLLFFSLSCRRRQNPPSMHICFLSLSLSLFHSFQSLKSYSLTITYMSSFQKIRHFLVSQKSLFPRMEKKTKMKIFWKKKTFFNQLEALKSVLSTNFMINYYSHITLYLGKN